MIDNPIHNGNLRDEGDDLHSAPALGADQRVNLIDFSDHLGLRVRFGPHQAVDIEAGVPLGENVLPSLRAEKFSTDEKRQDLPREDLGQPRVVDPWDLMEDARLVQSALGHLVIEV
jgi:hypothetical protein